MNVRYNFRLAPEAIWLIVNTVLGTLLVELSTTDFAAITDWRGWAIGLGIASIRTIIAAVLAAATDGFQGPGETKEADAADAVDAG